MSTQQPLTDEARNALLARLEELLVQLRNELTPDHSAIARTVGVGGGRGSCVPGSTGPAMYMVAYMLGGLCRALARVTDSADLTWVGLVRLEDHQRAVVAERETCADLARRATRHPEFEGMELADGYYGIASPTAHLTSHFIAEMIRRRGKEKTT